MYIALEGIDTAGKSTQITALREHFTDALFTKEPGATQVGKKIRDIVLHEKIASKRAEFLLFLADRAEHMKRVIQPNLGKKFIFSDRSLISGIAYALVDGSIKIETLVELNAFATEKIYPQKVFLLKLSKKELEYRLSQKKLDTIELRGSTYLLSIQNAIIQAAELLEIELIEINASLSPQEVTQSILSHLKNA